MAKRKKAKDYSDEYAGLLEKTVALQARIVARAEELCRLHPQAPIGHGAVGREFEKFKLGTLGYIDVIRNIEKYLDAQHPHQQTNIQFPEATEKAKKILKMWRKEDNITVVPESPVGERVLVNGSTGEAFSREPEQQDFIEYEDFGDDYIHPERIEVTELLHIRLYCMHEDCQIYIKGTEGYNGAFSAETGQYCDLRNQGYTCNKHR